MSSLRVTHPSKKVHASINLPSSKSISNRALILQSLFENYVELHNLSTADDTAIMQNALVNKSNIINVKNAGTCMRFLTAYFACKKGEVELHGEERMYQRPIKILVEALQQLGADISYLGEEGFPPLKINGKQLDGGKITVDASMSSQYITSLMLVAPTFKNGLTIHLAGENNSYSYINMTAELMKLFGFEIMFNNQTIHIPQHFATSRPYPFKYAIETDWSAASYWYEIAALSDECEILLNGLSLKSLQGDAIIAEYIKAFDVETIVTEKGIVLQKNNHQIIELSNQLHLSNTPDLAPTLAVIAAAKNIDMKLLGLQNLNIKESDRLTALETELKKCGFTISIAENNSSLLTHQHSPIIAHSSLIKTYNDHRMAMAFAPLCLLFDDIEIENPEVVKKSYPRFWDDLKLAGFEF